MSRADRPSSSRVVRLADWAVYPALLWTAGLFAVPLGIMLAVSLWRRVGGKLQADWTLANYIKFFDRSFFLEALGNSIEVTLIVTVISVLLAYPLAYILAYRIPKRWQKIALIMAILPFWTSYVVRSYSWLLILSNNGVVNWVLLNLGIVAEPLEMGYTRGATVLGFVHFFTMLLTLTIYANLVQISPSYRLAAADLGASAIQVFLRITLPLSLPGVAVGAFITFVIAIGDYITPQILGGGKEILIPQGIMLQIVRSANFPMAAAMSMILMVVVSLTYLLFARYLKMERV